MGIQFISWVLLGLSVVIWWSPIYPPLDVLNAIRRWKGVVDDPPHSGDWRVDDVTIKQNCDDLLALVQKEG